MNQLDLILSRDDAVEPSPDFAARVMNAVRRQAVTPPPLAIPWAWLAVAPALGLALVVAQLIESPLSLRASASFASWIAAGQAQLAAAGPQAWMLLGAAVAALGSLLLVQISLQLAGAKNGH